MKPKNKKKAISIMIGYILLISFAVVISVIVYQWIKTYVPRDSNACPEETSLFIKNYNYDCASNVLTLTLGNNGRFNLAGYFIYGSNSSQQELAAYDLSNFSNTKRVINVVKFSGDENSFKPDSQEVNIFDLNTSGIGKIYSILIVPVRLQGEGEKRYIVSCTSSKLKELIYCS